MVFHSRCIFLILFGIIIAILRSPSSSHGHYLENDYSNSFYMNDDEFLFSERLEQKLDFSFGDQDIFTSDALGRKSKAADSDSCNIIISGPTKRILRRYDGESFDTIAASVLVHGTDQKFLVSHHSSNEYVLHNEDIESTSYEPHHVDQYTKVYNFTLYLSFNKQVGKTDYTMLVKDPKKDTKIFCSAKLEYIFSGVSIFWMKKTKDKKSNALILDEEKISIPYTSVMLNNPLRLSILAQFPDGSSSDDGTKKGLLLSEALASTMDIAFIDGENLLDHNDSSCKNEGSIRSVSPGEKELLKCKIRVSFNKKDKRDPLHLLLNILPYKVGFIHFQIWHKYFSQERLSNSVLLDINGHVPAVISNVYPTKGLSTKGKDQIRVEIENAHAQSKYELYIPELRSQFSFLKYIARENNKGLLYFVSSVGIGVDLDWHMVEVDITENRTTAVKQHPFLFSYSKKLVISTVYPTIGPIQGFDATLFGEFEGCHKNIGTVVVDGEPLFIDSCTSTEIHFRMPPKQNSHQDFVKVWVVMENEVSNQVEFFYHAANFSVDIVTFGGSRLESGTVQDDNVLLCSRCSGVEIAAVSSLGTSGALRYSWTLTKDQEENVVVQRESQSPFLSLTPVMFQQWGYGRYRLNLLFSEMDLDGEKIIGQASASQEFMFLDRDKIGVTLLSPKNPTMEDDMIVVTAHIDEWNECFDLKEQLIYEWTYSNYATIIYKPGQEQAYSSAVSSSQSKNQVMVSKLGRELLIPKEHLVAGHSMVTLRVISILDTSFSGIGKIELNVNPSVVRPMINHKVTVETVSDRHALYLNTSRFGIVKNSSYDYEWRCEVAKSRDFSDGHACDDAFISWRYNGDEVYVDPQVLSSGPYNDLDRYYLRYSLETRSNKGKVSNAQLSVFEIIRGYMDEMSTALQESQTVELLQGRNEKIINVELSNNIAYKGESILMFSQYWVDGNNGLLFFYLEAQDNIRFCLGECSGNFIERFSVLVPGEYRLKVELRSREGQKLLDERMLETKLIILAHDDVSDKPEWTYIPGLEDLLRIGDQRNALSTILAFILHETNIMINQVMDALYFMAKASSPNQKISSMSLLEVTTAVATGRERERKRLGASSVTYEMSESDTYATWNIFSQIIDHNPKVDFLEALNIGILAFNHTYPRGKQRPSTRLRLKADTNSDDYINEILLDFMGIRTEVLVALGLRNQPCGHYSTIDSTHQHGKSWENEEHVFDVGSIYGQVWCVDADIDEIKGQYSSYIPCGRLEEPGPYHVVLQESGDYLRESGVIEAESSTEAARLIETGIFKGPERSMLSEEHQNVLFQPSCHELRVLMKEQRKLDDGEVLEAFEYANRKEYQVPMVQHNQGQIYNQRSVDNVLSTRWLDLQQAEMTSRTFGLWGFETSTKAIEPLPPSSSEEYPSSSVSGHEKLPIGYIIGVSVGLLALILALAAVVYGFLAYRARQAHFSAQEAQYIQRDVFGRYDGVAG